jgi:hypothetical protein
LVARRHLRISDRATIKPERAGQCHTCVMVQMLRRCGASEGPMNTTTTTERQLLELAAQAISFKYLMYVPQSYHLRGGLLHSSQNGCTKIWNPLLDDADLLYLAVASPAVSLQDIIVEAAGIDGTDDARRAYVREHFVRAVAANVAAAQKGVVDADAVTPGQSPVPATSLEAEP